jgi:hypothetical protein
MSRAEIERMRLQIRRQLKEIQRFDFGDKYCVGGIVAGADASDR